MTENEILLSALKKVEAQQDNLGGFMDRFNIKEHWAVRKALEEIQEYRNTGTVEECEVAVSKTKQMTPVNYDKHYYKCPACNEDLEIDNDSVYVYGEIPPRYCKHCGQALSWTKGE